MKTKLPTALWLSSALLAALAAGCTGPASLQGTVARTADTVISDKVRLALSSDPQLDGWRVEVAAFDGTVQLRGIVWNAIDRDRAAEIARRVAGVQQVRNDILVRTHSGSRQRTLSTRHRRATGGHP